MDLVEGSTSSKEEKETTDRGGTSNVEVPASQGRVKVMDEWDTTGSSGELKGNRSKRVGLKKGAVVTAGEQMLQEQPPKQRNGDAPLGYSGRTALRREQCDMLRNGEPPHQH